MKQLRQTIMKLLCFALLLTINLTAFAQSKETPNTSKTQRIKWKYSASNTEYGPMDALVELEYYFFRAPGAARDKYTLESHVRFISMEYIGNRWKYHGKVYTSDVLQSWDSRGLDCFRDVILDRVNIKIGFNGVNNAKKIDIEMGNNYDWGLCEISNTFDLNDISLNVVLATCSYIGCKDGNCVNQRIDNFEKGVKNQNEYKSNIQEADQAYNSKNWQVAKNKYEKASTIFPNENYPKDQLEKIKGEELKAKNIAKSKELVKEGDNKFERRDFEGAKQKYEEALSIIPDDSYSKSQLTKIKQAESDKKKEEDRLAKIKQDALNAETAKDKLDAGKQNNNAATKGSNSSSPNQSKNNAKNKTGNQGENSTQSSSSNNKSDNSTSSASNNQKTAENNTRVPSEEERKAAMDEQNKKIRDKKIAEDKRIADAKAEENKQRQQEYDSWKTKAQAERSKQDIATAESMSTILLLLGGFIYDGMGDVDPYAAVYQTPPNNNPSFFMTNSFGYSFSVEPMLFQSNINSMDNGVPVNKQEITGDYGYYLNLGGQSNIGFANDNYSIYGLLGMKLGVIPWLNGAQYTLGVGAGFDVGFKNIKFYTQYKYNPFDEKSMTLSDVEESGSGDYSIASNELSYGIKFTFGGNKDDDFKRVHICIGVIEKSFSFDGISSQSYFDPVSQSIMSLGTPTTKGYTFEVRKDNTFCLFLRYYDQHILVGATGDIKNTSMGTTGTGSFFEIGFYRALDFF